MTSYRRNPARLWQFAAIFLMGGMTCACSSEGNDWAGLFNIAMGSWRQADVQLNEAAAISYATLGVRIGDGPERIMILSTDSRGERLWTASGVALSTRFGRIVSTAGFAGNLSSSALAAASAPSWKTARQYGWTADFADIGAYSIRIECRSRPAGEETINILGKDLRTLRVDESCASAQLKWNFDNVYWVDPQSERVWRSIQHIHPRGDSLEIELLRPPQSED
jgi:hypothetical protein